jgi:catechol 2,3-dioxygenase-like lactoylglutathione lyase family enzyme
MQRLSQLHHVGLTVTDMDRSIQFYGSLFGLTEIARLEMGGETVASNLEVPGARILVVLLRGANSILEFIQYLSPRGEPFALRNCDVGAPHVCFAVEDIEAFARELEARGGALNGPPNDPVPDGPAAGSRFAYFRDPDGITVEVLQPGPGIRL